MRPCPDLPERDGFPGEGTQSALVRGRFSPGYSDRSAGVADAQPSATPVVALPQRGKRCLLPPKTGVRVLLLQGPVGPFFSHLQSFLEKNGFDAWRISFNTGDRLFSSRKKQLEYRGDLAAWSAWLRNVLVAEGVDHVVLFGAERPLHDAARKQAFALGIDVVSLEEGYVRPGLVTIEHGGNNWTSPIARALPPDDFEDDGATVNRLDFRSFRAMCLWGITYYVTSALFSTGRQRHLSHRHLSLFELVAWPRNVFRWFIHQSENFDTIQKLLEHFDKRFFLVALQIPSDTQLGRAACCWTNVRLITETLSSFAKAGPKGYRLVFKVHPLDRGHSDARRMVRKIARRLGIADRVDVIDTGSLGLLTRHSAGMITINSTSGLSAIFHGVPILVVGEALYANASLATCARGKPDFNSFWKKNFVAEASLRERYLAWVQHQSLRPGDYYARAGMDAACAAIIETLCAGFVPAQATPDSAVDVAAVETTYGRTAAAC